MKHPVARLHKKCSIDYVDVRFDTQLLLLVHKFLYSEVQGIGTAGLLKKQNNPAGRVTRAANKMELVFPHDIKIRKSPLYRAVDVWNSLPPAIRLTADKPVFKTEVIKILRARNTAMHLGVRT